MGGIEAGVSVWSPFPGVEVSVPDGWRIDVASLPAALLPAESEAAIQLNWIVPPMHETEAGLHLNAVGAANRWRAIEFPDTDHVLTVVATDYQFVDSFGLWLEAPHSSERAPRSGRGSRGPDAVQ